MPRRALVVLEDGASFAGEALVGTGTAGGEVVFTTGMTGYQEVASDPSYHGQVIVYTFPLVGNYGASAAVDESDTAHARAVVARELTNYRHNRAATSGWLDWLDERDVLAVSGVDTRALTRHIREKGALRAVVTTDDVDVATARSLARRLPQMSGLDLAKAVTCRQPYTVAADEEGDGRHVVVLDFGVKRSILRQLSGHGFRLTVLPGDSGAGEVLRRRPDGVILSNGPGDPAAVNYGVKAVERLLGRVPLFGICLGHQLLALALGLQTFKLKFGHRGINHPVKDLFTGRIEITAQNHGFAVRAEEPFPPGVGVTHVNLYDGTVEGVACPEMAAFSVQYHPESSPGPHDSRYLFARFAQAVERGAERGAPRERQERAVPGEKSRAGAGMRRRRAEERD